MDGVNQLTDVIQVCTDGSQLSEKGVDTAVALAQSLNLPLLGMAGVPGAPVAGGLEKEDSKTQERLKYIKYELVAEHCQAPWQGILAVAKRYAARFIVMASRGLGSLGSLILGSETQKVLAAADRPGLVIR